jgi:hypothetical protein
MAHHCREIAVLAEGEGLRHPASGVGRLHLAKTKLSGCDRWKLKKAKGSQVRTGGTQ